MRGCANSRKNRGRKKWGRNDKRWTVRWTKVRWAVVMYASFAVLRIKSLEIRPPGTNIDKKALPPNPKCTNRKKPGEESVDGSS